MPRPPLDSADQEACALHVLAVRLLEEGEPRRAHEAALRAARAFQAIDGPRSPDVAHALLIAGRAAVAWDRHRRALTLTTRAAAILGKHHDPGNRDLARLQAQAFGGVGEVRLARGEYALARTAYRRALAVAVKLRGPELATALNNLAVVDKFLGRWDEASRLYRRALRISRRLADQGGDRSDLAAILHNLGGLEHARGRFARGVPYAREGLALRERAHGRSHLAVAADVAALAALLEGTGARAEARRLYRRALSLYEKKIGPDHFEVGFNLANLAALEHGAGRYTVAEPLYRRALAVEQRALGRGHPYVGTTLRNLAALCEEQGRAAEARRWLERARRIFTGALGPRHPDTAECARAIKAAQRPPAPRARRVRAMSSSSARSEGKRSSMA